MTTNDLLQKLYIDETVSIMDIDPETDDIGENQYYQGLVGNLLCDDEKLAAIGSREVKAIRRGMVSLIIGI